MNSILTRIIPDNLLKRGFLSYVFAFISVVILPIHVQYIPPFMSMWLLCWGLEKHIQVDQRYSFIPLHKVLFFLFILYYLWQVAGLIYTSNIKLGLLNLFSRLSLILFPIVLLYPGKIIKYNARTLIRIFALSCSIFIFFCFAYALFRSVNLQNGVWTFNPHPGEFFWMSYFYGPDLTISQHPSYIAMYVLLSAFICFESWFDQSLKFKLRILWLVIGVILLISQYFISSRAGIFGTLILVPIYLIIKLRKIGKKKFMPIGKIPLKKLK